VAPNPMVGSVLVYQDRIIGSGYHQQYGGAHAEVHCLESVAEADRPFISEATLYVSLEPCAHYGKTPPCADLIVRHRIPRVVIGCTDTFSKVSGLGIERLKQAGIEVKVGVLEQACRDLNAAFFTYHEKKRPYIVLKWAQSADGFIAKADGQPVAISNAYTNRMVHKWRAAMGAILVGRRTLENDQPQLGNRYWTGGQPIRMFLGRHIQASSFAPAAPGQQTILYNQDTINFDKPIWEQIWQDCYHRGIQSILIEGGAQTLQHLIDTSGYDEVRIIKGSSILNNGMPAPVLRGAEWVQTQCIHGDQIETWKFIIR
jgi:diaminohydroxyphosphoribosylaminopyrimidine deaminase/5-amino-6-(5-phosphoribosylamino)uracil reductase